MLTKWQARGRIALLAAAVILIAVQATLLVTLNGLVTGAALVLATGHVMSAPLALWRPVPAAGLSLIASTLQALAVMSQGPTGWPWAIAPQVITQLLVVLVLTVVAGWRIAAGTVILQLLIGIALAVAGLAWNDVGVSLGYVLLFAGLALLVGSLGALGGRLVEIRDALSHERRISAEEHARRTVVEEKSRIARELHDVIAHNMSLITVQARSAPHRVEGVGPAAQAEFGEIADRAAEALRQMRGVLDVLRTEPGQSGRVPVPTVEELGDLFESARGTGQEVIVQGAPPAADRVTPEVGAATYRIVQEALSNARRHAPERPVHVDLTVKESEFEMRITNPVDGPVEDGAEGHGVVGMRERASAAGGRLTAGADGGDYLVVATLPLRDAAAGLGAGS